MNPELISFLTNLVIFCVGFYAGRNFMIKIYSQMMVDDTERMIEHLQNIQKIKDIDEDDETEVVVEQHNDRFYVYNKVTHLFLGQGHSIDEAMKIVSERFPDQIFVYEETN